MNLLIIRPQPGADATAARVRAAGHHALLMPLFDVRPIEWELPTAERFDALLLTSSNAVRHAGDQLKAFHELPAVAVGSATARAAKQAGLAVAITGTLDVTDVLARAHEAGYRRLLWLAGRDRITVSGPDDLTMLIRDVYRSEALPAPKNFSEAVSLAQAVLLHSPRAATHFAGLCDTKGIDRAQIKIAALSPGIATGAGKGWKSVIVAPSPSDNMLLAQLE